MLFKKKITVRGNTKIATGVRGMNKILSKEIGGAENFERCFGVPMIKYSVLEGFTESLLEKNQEWTELRVEERSDKLEIDSLGGNEM